MRAASGPDRHPRGTARPRPSRRLLVRIAVAVASVAVLVTVTAGTAAAHAQLESTSPDASSVLEVPPAQVVLRFGEPVEIDFGSLRVIGPSDQRVDSGGAHHPAGESHAVAVALPPGLHRGTYIVAWRVISADSHPVHGAFIFSIGSAGGARRAASLATTLADQSGSAVVGVIYWMIRVAAFVGLLVLVGLGTMVLVAWPRGGRTRRIGRILWGSWLLVGVATVAGIVVQGVYAAALPVGDITRTSLIADVLPTRFGEVEVFRLLLLAASVPMVLVVRGRLGEGSPRRPLVLAGGGALLGIALLTTPGLAGHATTGSRPLLGLLLDVVHLGAASLWLGGLVLLATFLVAGDRPEDRPDDPRRVTRTVSAWAFGAVVAVVATGTVQSIRQVGSLYALLHTAYGRILLVKIGLVIVLIGVGALSRWALHGGFGLRRTPGVESPDRPDDGSDGFPRRRLRRSVLVELVLALCILAVTGLLVNAVPARQAAAQPFSTSFTTLGVEVNAIVAPAKVGPGNEVHIYVLSAEGTPKAIPELDATISLPSRHLGPLTVPLRVVGPGHFTASDVDLPIAGTWTLTLTVRTDAIDEQVVSTTLPVH